MIDDQNNWPGPHLRYGWWLLSSWRGGKTIWRRGGDDSSRLDVRLVILISGRNLKVNFQRGDFYTLMSCRYQLFGFPVAKCIHSLEFPTLA